MLAVIYVCQQNFEWNTLIFHDAPNRNNQKKNEKDEAENNKKIA